MNVVKFNVTDAEIAKLKEQYLPLKINGVDDKAGLKSVYDARQVVKKTRVGVEKFAKEMKETAIAWQKKVNAEQGRVCGELESIEAHLQGEEDAVAAEKERIRVEAEEKEKARIQSRIDKLAAYGFAIDYTLISTIDDIKFSDVLASAKLEHEKELSVKAEAERIQKEEQERLKRERAELEELRRQQAEAQKIIEANNARILKEQQDKEAAIRKEQEAKEAAIRAEQNKIEDEKNKLKKEKADAIAAQQRAEEIQKAKEQAAEAARLKQIADAKKEQEDILEANRLARIEQERQSALRPDKEKLEAFAKRIGSLIDFEVKDAKAQAILNDVSTMIGKMQIHILKKIKEL